MGNGARLEILAPGEIDSLGFAVQRPVSATTSRSPKASLGVSSA